ncbi:hypothetical protein DRQ50_00720 [bacterium]|nr:MAG: hypothetical protein DRQ50_00720 [bacterium]
MKWLHNRFLPVAHIALLASFVVIGCTGKQDPKETLVLCGNHTCGELAMVTTDTSSKGFYYLNPTVSPDGSEVLFTADWRAMPADPKEPDDEYYINYRQLVTVPMQAGFEPSLDLAEQGAELIRLTETAIEIQGNLTSMVGAENYDKGDPIWETDLSVIFSMRLDPISALRLFRADITDKAAAVSEPLFLEERDNMEIPGKEQHLAPNLSRDGRWLIFTHHAGFANAGDLDTYEGLQLYALDMAPTREPGYDPYDARAFPLTKVYRRIERPRFSPDGSRIVFSASLDLVNSSDDGTEIFTMDFDTTGLAATDTVVYDSNIQRVTFTSRAEGDPIAGILNYSPCFSPNGADIYFVSTRRAPATTVHARAIWQVPADGGQDPEIYFFSRFDDVDPTILDNGTLLMSSTFGFPSEVLDQLEEEAYQRIKAENEQDHADDPVGKPLFTEVELREKASDERRQLENFEGVMAHLYVFN